MPASRLEVITEERHLRPGIAGTDPQTPMWSDTPERPSIHPDSSPYVIIVQIAAEPNPLTVELGEDKHETSA